MQRFVLSVTINSKEVIRRAIYANNAEEAAKMDVFSKEEFDMLARATATEKVNFTIT